MKRCVLILTVLVFMAGCHEEPFKDAPLHPTTPVPQTDSCTVKDNADRLWQIRNAANACEKAMHDCSRWHMKGTEHRYNGCHVVNRLPDN